MPNNRSLTPDQTSALRALYGCAAQLVRNANYAPTTTERRSTKEHRVHDRLVSGNDFARLVEILEMVRRTIRKNARAREAASS